MSGNQGVQMSPPKSRTTGRRRSRTVLEVADRRIAMPYRPHPAKWLAGIIFFTFAALSLGYLARVNANGLAITGLIRLDVVQATRFYYFLSGSSIAFVALGLAYVLPQLFISRRIVLDAATITLPLPGFTKKHRTLATADIVGATIHQRRGKAHLIQVRTEKGAFNISAASLPAAEDFFAVLVWIKTHVKSLA
jgi:hypothetical protein